MKSCLKRGAQLLSGQSLFFVSLEGQQQDRMPGAPRAGRECQLSQAILIYPCKDFGLYPVNRGKLSEDCK